MKNRFLAGALLALLLSGPLVAQAGIVKDGLSSTSENVGNGLAPVGEDVDYLGRSLFYGIGAALAAPFRLLQDIFNGISQGAANEKLCDHTN